MSSGDLSGASREALDDAIDALANAQLGIPALVGGLANHSERRRRDEGVTVMKFSANDALNAVSDVAVDVRELIDAYKVLVAAAQATLRLVREARRGASAMHDYLMPHNFSVGAEDPEHCPPNCPALKQAELKGDPQDRCDSCDINVVPAGTGRCPRCLGDLRRIEEESDAPRRRTTT